MCVCLAYVCRLNAILMFGLCSIKSLIAYVSSSENAADPLYYSSQGSGLLPVESSAKWSS